MREVAVLVPVLRRPGNAGPFMESLRASTGQVAVCVIAEAGDIETKRAWRAAGADQVFTTTLRTFAQKINFGYRETSERWLFLVGDDVRFHPGWLDNALNVASAAGAYVVGTNDLGNSRVLAGEHATHLLIRRTYVDQIGASWDGPGVVCHEGYRHWYVDDELVTAAKQRGVWAPCLNSVVEHLHPLWGKADDDAVYRLGLTSLAADRDLFERRRATYAR